MRIAVFDGKLETNGRIPGISPNRIDDMLKFVERSDQGGKTKTGRRLTFKLNTTLDSIIR